MVIPDPARQGTAVERAVRQRIQTLPDAIASELRRWVQVVRGEGRREHQELPFTTIRSYLNCFYPVLATWAGRVTSLREITRDDIQAALDERPGVTAHNLLPALRSLFRALRQERIIFRDPSRGISLSAMRRLPVPIPASQLRGLIDRAEAPMAKLIVALIAIHALGNKETTQLLLADLDLPAGRSSSAGPPARTPSTSTSSPARSLSAGSANGTAAGPSPTNPHLLVSQVTAADTALAPIAHTVMDAIFRRLGLSPSKLRQDRILDEARHTADPVHLMRVFGLTANPAMHYVQAAHPERRST